MKQDYSRYQQFENMPVAFGVIEVLQDNKKSSLDPYNFILRYANKENENVSGVPAEYKIGKSIGELYPDIDNRSLSCYYETAIDGVSHKIREYNEKFKKFIQISTYMIKPGFCGCIMEEIVDYQDSLMDCLNAEGFKLRAEQILAEHPNETFIFSYCDIRCFKYINQDYGFEEGNHLLSTLGRAISKFIDGKGILGRITGDNFVAMMKYEGEATFKNAFLSFIDNFAKSYQKETNQNYPVDVTAGAFVRKPSDKDTMSINHCLDFANSARILAKKSKGNRLEFFSRDLWEKEKRAAEISAHLKQAIADGEITPWFQPQYDYKREKLIGAEVLTRWTHPVYGKIFPDEFIHVLEETGQILELDFYIWECACKCMEKWQKDGFSIPLSINLSRKDVLSYKLREHLIKLTEKYHLDRKMLHLEITESAYMDTPDELIQIVQDLTDAGFHVEMDDFGSGYSSLNMLQDVPVQTIKMDLRFLTNIEHNSKTGNIISSVVRMAHGLDMAVIAEGVETRQQADFLKNIGCNFMQGYYFAKPLPQDEFEEKCMLNPSLVDDSEFNRINIDEIQEFLTANNSSSFIFNSCIGAGAILEYSSHNIEIVLANDKFFEMNGGLTDNVKVEKKSQNKLFSPEAIELLERTIDHCIKNGESKCKAHINTTNIWVEIRYTLISKNDTSAYLFCQMENITQEYILQKEMDAVKTETQTILDLMPGGAFKYEADGEQQFAYISNGVPELLGYSSVDDFKLAVDNSFLHMIYERDRARVLDEINRQVAIDGTGYCEYRIVKADGSMLWVFDRGRLVTDDNGKKWFYGIITDADKLKKLEIEQQWKQTQFKALAQMPGVITYDYNPHTDLLNLDVSDKDGKIHEIVTEHFLDKITEHPWIAPESGPAHKAAYENAMKKQMSGYVDFMGRFEGDEFLYYRSYYTSVVDATGHVYRIVGRADKIEHDVQIIRALQNKAQRDSLTGLLNYESMIITIENDLQAMQGGILMMIDIDDFKGINDKYGHLTGNAMLIRVANILLSTFRQHDTVGRFGGDEFMVYVPNVTDKNWVEKRADKLIQLLGSIEVTADEHLSVSIGVCINGEGKLTLTEMIKAADKAMYDAKADGKNTFKVR